jgi:hypothetical protein
MPRAALRTASEGGPCKRDGEEQSSVARFLDRADMGRSSAAPLNKERESESGRPEKPKRAA